MALSVLPSQTLVRASKHQCFAAYSIGPAFKKPFTCYRSQETTGAKAEALQPQVKPNPQAVADAQPSSPAPPAKAAADDPDSSNVVPLNGLDGGTGKKRRRKRAELTAQDQSQSQAQQRRLEQLRAEVAALQGKQQHLHQQMSRKAQASAACAAPLPPAAPAPLRPCGTTALASRLTKFGVYRACILSIGLHACVQEAQNVRQQLVAQEETAAQLRQAKEAAEAAAQQMQRQLEEARAAAAAAREQASKASKQTDSIQAYKRQLTEVRRGCHPPPSSPPLLLLRKRISAAAPPPHLSLRASPQPACRGLWLPAVQAQATADDATAQLQAARMERESLKAEVGACRAPRLCDSPALPCSPLAPGPLVLQYGFSMMKWMHPNIALHALLLADHQCRARRQGSQAGRRSGPAAGGGSRGGAAQAEGVGGEASGPA